MISCLSDICFRYLRKHLNVSNVFCVLKHAQLYENKDLLSECWELIDKDTDEALKSEEFLAIGRSLLEELVQRSTLNIREVDLFSAVDCWAKEECKRLNLSLDGTGVKRQILGKKVIKCIRFPVMKESDFKEFVVESNILTQKETSNIIKYFNSTLNSPVAA
ncbi:hypothetical protein ACROYT_G019533 [Oculina patagonica]